MKAILIIPPILLFREFLKNNSLYYIILIIWLSYKFINVQYEYFYKNESNIFVLILSWVLFFVVFIFAVSNPFETDYKPRKSFLNLRYFNKSYSKKSLEILQKYYPPFTLFMGFIIWFIVVSQSSSDPFETALYIAPISLFLYLLPRIMGVHKELKRTEMHEDIDFISNIDIKEAFGTSDKLIIAYQNFNLDNQKSKIENGDYIVGVSANSLFFIFKEEENEINNVRMRFSDVQKVGFLTFYNKSVLKFVDSYNISISIVIEHDDSLLVNSFLLIQNILSAFDNYLLGEISSTSSNRKRKIEYVSNERLETQLEKYSRVIELTYSPAILNEINHSINISNNRKIEL